MGDFHLKQVLVPDLQGHGVDIEQALFLYRGYDALVYLRFGFTKFVSFRIIPWKIGS